MFPGALHTTSRVGEVSFVVSSVLEAPVSLPD